MLYHCILTSPSPTLFRSDLLLVFIFSPPFGFMAHTQQQAEGSEQKALFCLAESPKVGSEHHRHTRFYHPGLTCPPQLLLEHHSEGRGAPFSLSVVSALKQLIKLKAINFNSADLKAVWRKCFQAWQITLTPAQPQV